jgi:hypothetical protein
MAGLVPAIHDLILGIKDMDARTESEHDDVVFGSTLSEKGLHLLDPLQSSRHLRL